MERRHRSPNYPSFSLPIAIEKVAALYAAQHRHPAPREIVATGMGYNTLNGASATAISALHKYGLLEGRGDQLRVSDRALRILHPESDEEKAAAVREAAAEPALFAELNERFPGNLPNDELLRNYLIRRGFAPNAVTSAIASYRETSEMVERESWPHDSRREQPQDHAAMVYANSTPESVGSASLSTQLAAAEAAAARSKEAPIITIMEGYFVVNATALRTREKARTLRELIERLEWMLPEETPKDAVTRLSPNEAVPETIVDRPQRLVAPKTPSE
jgi:hypothetical protein